ncbi:hypothetical protein LTR37_020500 [Vermiconidia calcicola]|uniref:Uncharacterized protein n=1 Tax=Vermiconidia calcicola TaxID=1690605 RepID=A0ACC3MBA9_9PEZI|nr:hypothetical protein LTR37_020500 [Vermiconidia calcicola]
MWDDTRDIVGLREQILDNVHIIFPLYYKGVQAAAEVKFKIVIECFDDARSPHYRAEVRWGVQMKPFLTGGIEHTPPEALEELLICSAVALSELKREGRMEDAYDRGSAKEVCDGWIVTDVTDTDED